MDTRIATRASIAMLCSCLAAACGTDDKPDPTLVKVASGEVRGSIVGTSRQFLGIRGNIQNECPVPRGDVGRELRAERSP